MSKQITKLLVLTLVAFALVEGVWVVTGQGWSWIWAIGFGLVLCLQAIALAEERSR